MSELDVIAIHIRAEQAAHPGRLLMKRTMRSLAGAPADRDSHRDGVGQ